MVVKKTFKSKWHSKKKLPTIVSISLITWTADQRKSFEAYRFVFFAFVGHCTALMFLMQRQSSQAVETKEQRSEAVQV